MTLRYQSLVFGDLLQSVQTRHGEQNHGRGVVTWNCAVVLSLAQDTQPSLSEAPGQGSCLLVRGGACGVSQAELFPFSFSVFFSELGDA